MRRPTFAIVVLAAVAAFVAAGVYLIGDGGPGSIGPLRSEATGAPIPEAGSRTRGAGSRKASVPAGPGSLLAGRVVNPQGVPVPRASVAAVGHARAVTAADDSGAFVLPDLDPGEYLLHASMGSAASVPLGPIPLGRGEELRELVLVLEAAAALSGTIMDALGKQPLVGARVSGGAATAVSDEAGHYVLMGLPSGRLTVTATAEGYLPRRAEVEVLAGKERQGTDIHLERGARVFGTVRAGSTVLAGAQVFVSRYGFGEGNAIEAVTSTSVDGRFSGLVQPGRFQLLARAAGWAEARTEDLDLSPGEERQVDLSLEAGSSVLGVVWDAEGVPVASCEVQSFDSVHRLVTGTAITGPGGQFSIGSLPASVHSVVASCAAGHAEVQGIKVGGREVHVDLRLGRGRIAGRVLDGERRPISAARVGLREDGSASPPWVVTSTDDGGRFEFHGLAGASYAVSASAPQGQAEVAGVEPDASEAVLVLDGGLLVGTVVGDHLEAVPDFVVYAEPLRLGFGKPRSQRFVAPNGAFELVLPAGEYAVRAGSPGYGPGGVDRVVVRGGEEARVRLELHRGEVVRGRTVDDKGRGLAGVRVTNDADLLWAYGRAAPVPEGAQAVSDSSGGFVLAGVKPGDRVRLFAKKEGYAVRQVVVRIPSADEVVITLPAERRRESEPEYAGIGAALWERDGKILIVQVFEGGPAREAGLRPNDEIIAVDGVSVAGLSVDAVVASVRGLVGTTVRLVIRRDGEDVPVAIARSQIKY